MPIHSPGEKKCTPSASSWQPLEALPGGQAQAIADGGIDVHRLGQVPDREAAAKGQGRLVNDVGRPRRQHLHPQDAAGVGLGTDQDSPPAFAQDMGLGHPRQVEKGLRHLFPPGPGLVGGKPDHGELGIGEDGHRRVAVVDAQVGLGVEHVGHGQLRLPGSGRGDEGRAGAVPGRPDALGRGLQFLVDGNEAGRIDLHAGSLQADEQSHRKAAEDLLLIMRFGKQVSDSYEQMISMQKEQMKNMGPMKDIMSQMPGMGDMIPEGEDPETAFKRIQGMIDAMTKQERKNPDIIDISRRRRIAAGRGTQPHEIKQFLNQFDQIRTLMRQMAQMSIWQRLKMVTGMTKSGMLGPGGLMMPKTKIGTGHRKSPKERAEERRKKNKKKRR